MQDSGVVLLCRGYGGHVGGQDDTGYSVSWIPPALGASAELLG
jgi:hypothetical protein